MEQFSRRLKKKQKFHSIPKQQSKTMLDWQKWFSLAVTILILILMITHLSINHSIHNGIRMVSYVTSVTLLCASSSATALYFIPAIDESCICAALWATTLSFYCISVFMFKCQYLERTKKMNQVRYVQSVYPIHLPHMTSNE